MTTFENAYEDDAYASAYARLEFPGTYYLAFRDLPEILSRNVTGSDALDIGCGTGRSTRFLAQLGFAAIGADIAEEMIQKARTLDAGGDYRLVPDGDLSQFADASFDLALSAFTFDNIPTAERKVTLLIEVARVLRPGGRMINLVSSPEIYRHEWASFSTRDFPENRHAVSGDEVKIIVTALDDKRPVTDVLWSEQAYRDVYAQAGLEVLEICRPLGRGDEPYDWVNETTVAPWTIYVLAKTGATSALRRRGVG
ncbi:MAG: class I SAM-dependent methyltransferase [Phycisphaerae bacterium]|jgi:ubiquinone/menaquinone biosynthesis C-methylase UbiE